MNQAELSDQQVVAAPRASLCGTTIRMIRKALGLKQDQLASILGVHAVTVCRWESGAGAPGPYHETILIRLDSAAARRDQIGDLAQRLCAHGPVHVLWFLLNLTEDHP